MLSRPRRSAVENSFSSSSCTHSSHLGSACTALSHRIQHNSQEHDAAPIMADTSHLTEKPHENGTLLMWKLV